MLSRKPLLSKIGIANDLGCGLSIVLFLANSLLQAMRRRDPFLC